MPLLIHPAILLITSPPGHSMGGKTAMVTALNHPEVIEKLVVVDVSPQRAPGKRESTDLIGAMKNLDIMSLRNRREADLILKKDIKVGLSVQ